MPSFKDPAIGPSEKHSKYFDPDDSSSSMSTSIEEEHLLEKEQLLCALSGNMRRERGFRSRRGVYISVGLNLFLATVIGAMVIVRTLQPAASPREPYSPARAALGTELVPVLFSSTEEGHASPYFGPPNDENNRLWDELTSLGQSRLTVEEARPLVNRTLPIPDDPGHYVIQLSVFHALHCLNAIRKNLHDPVWRSNVEVGGRGYHLDHCVDLIRQNLQCCSDITPLPYARLGDSAAHGISENVHSCRDFSKVQKWATEHKLVVPFDLYKQVDDDPLGWGDTTF